MSSLFMLSSSSRRCLWKATTASSQRLAQEMNLRTASSLARASAPSSSLWIWTAAAAVVVAMGATTTTYNNNSNNSSNLDIILASAGTFITTTTSCDRIPRAGDVVIVGTPVKEKSTGIEFPPLCNGFAFVGCGSRMKWGFVNVYAVGTYLDSVSMNVVKKQPREELEKALLDPKYHRTIRIVMARSVEAEKYNEAIVEALKPRMKGQDLDKLEEFKNLNPPGTMAEGDVVEITIRGDSLFFNSRGSLGTIHSRALVEAMCDVYYGKNAVSLPHKEDVLKNIPNMP